MPALSPDLKKEPEVPLLPAVAILGARSGRREQLVAWVIGLFIALAFAYFLSIGLT
jgi:hypothetical protein